ncbi:phenylacetate--CoA ligase family protein [Candidatus Giovannonibacteria bacterium]|nr:phenylacetate--CoA ligase family protein [Candidatus Giovannonibacteria bacterium]
MENCTEDLIIRPEKSFKPSINFSNLLGNSHFAENLEPIISSLRESQYWPLSKLEQIREERFRNLSHDIRSSKFWSEYFKKYAISTSSSEVSEELLKFPVINRNDFRNWGKNVFIYQKDLNIFKTITSGTSGTPLEIILDKKTASIAYFSFFFRNPIFEKIDLGILNRKFIVSLGNHGLRRWFRDFIYLFSISPSDLEKKEVRQKIYKQFEKIPDGMLGGFASVVLKFAEYAADEKIKFPGLSAIKISSEGIGLNDRTFIEKTFGAPVLNELNCSEAGMIGFECPENLGKFHLNAERIIMEIVGENNEALGKNKEGKIIITALDRIAMPIIRYEIGDRGKLLSEICRCGRTLPLFEFTGRQNNSLIFSDGKKIRSIIIQSALIKSGLAKKCNFIQLKQLNPYDFQFTIIPSPLYSKEDETKIRVILTNLTENRKIKIDFEYKNISDLKNNKPSFFVPLQ